MLQTEGSNSRFGFSEFEFILAAVCFDPRGFFVLRISDFVSLVSLCDKLFMNLQEVSQWKNSS
jgi:hypothetical protein